MSLDAGTSRISKFGRVVWDAKEGITVEGFEGENCTCRDIAVLAMCHAVAALVDDLRKTIEQPGGGTAGVA